MLKLTSQNKLSFEPLKLRNKRVSKKSTTSKPSKSRNLCTLKLTKPRAKNIASEPSQSLAKPPLEPTTGCDSKTSPQSTQTKADKRDTFVSDLCYSLNEPLRKEGTSPCKTAYSVVAESVSLKTCRSRFDKFIYYENTSNRSPVSRRRAREPSRICVKEVGNFVNKPRKLRRICKKYISKNVPRSSRIHLYVKGAFARHSFMDGNNRTRMIGRLWSKHELRLTKEKLKWKLKEGQYPKMEPYFNIGVYKTQNHRINHCRFILRP